MNKIDIKEFRSEGFLQEANRLFFHPLGLALEVVTEKDGSEALSCVQDYRGDPEGVAYIPDIISQDKIDRVEQLRKSKVRARAKLPDINRKGIQLK